MKQNKGLIYLLIMALMLIAALTLKSCVNILTIRDSAGAKIDYNEQKSGVATELDTKVDNQISQAVNAALKKEAKHIQEDVQDSLKVMEKTIQGDMKQEAKIQRDSIVQIIDSAKYKRE